MNAETARQILTTRFKNQWAILQPTVTVFIEGISEPDLNQQKAPFVMFRVTEPGVKQGSLSPVAELKRYKGRVEIVLFNPEGKGTKFFFDATDTITTILAMQTVGGVVISNILVVKRPSALGWQSRVALVDYSFDSIT